MTRSDGRAVPGDLEDDAETKPTFGALLRRHRHAAGLTQEALADRSGLAARGIQDLERGIHLPQRATTQRLIPALALVGDERSQFEQLSGTLPRRNRTLASVRLVPFRESEPATRTRANLPEPLTSLVGREADLITIKDLLRKSRLLTLTGSGGCGKSRLALAVALEVAPDFVDGVILVELASLADPSLIPHAIARAFGLRDRSNRTIVESLVDHLRGRRCLLVLDNCEHLIDGCARILAELLGICRFLAVLATSRQPLRIAGETQWRVPSLETPDATGRATDDDDVDPDFLVKKYAAVRLFVDRARAARPGFTVAKRNAHAVAQVCARLDGIPLAIELAASLVEALSVEQISRRLNDSFALLTRGDRSALPRQQTLRATFDWSYDLLNLPERIVFRRLAVFAGGFTVEAAEDVCAGDGLVGSDVLSILVNLVDKSLVQAQEDGTDGRYRLLEALREYGWERIAQANEGMALRNRHRDWCLALAERLEPELFGVDATTALRVLETEHDNLRAALAWCRQEDASAGLRLAASLRWFWIRRGHLAEGSRWLEIMLDLAPEHARSRASALLGAGVLARDRGDMSAATSFLEESLRLHREVGDREGIAMGLVWLGLQSEVEGDYYRAKLLLEESLAVGRGITNRPVAGFALGYLSNLALREGDVIGAKQRAEEMLAYFLEDGNPLGIAVALQDLGDVAASEGDYARARGYLSDALARRREIGDPRSIASTLSSLGELARLEGDYPHARALLAEALSIYHNTGAWESGGALASLGEVARLEGDLLRATAQLRESLAFLRTVGDRSAICRALCLIGLVAIEQRAPGRALRLFAGATANAPHGVPLEPAEPAPYHAALAAARATLDEEAFTRLWREGQTMTLDQVIEYALSEEPPGE